METHMQYKTIVLEMLKERTELHQQLRKERRLLKTMELYARELKTSHEAWKEQLRQQRPGSEASQISSEAFEMALQELEQRLPPESVMDDETLSLDQAMAFIRHPSRRG
jgi:superfamily I DNA/RNA helicase